MNSPRKGQWRGALMLSFICVWINGLVNNHKAGDLRCYCAHYDVTVMYHSSSLIKYSKKYSDIVMWHASFWVLYSRKSRQKCHMTTLLSLLAWIKYEYLSPKHTKYRFRHPGGPFGQEGPGKRDYTLAKKFEMFPRVELYQLNPCKGFSLLILGCVNDLDSPNR